MLALLDLQMNAWSMISATVPMISWVLGGYTAPFSDIISMTFVVRIQRCGTFQPEVFWGFFWEEKWNTNVIKLDRTRITNNVYLGVSQSWCHWCSLYLMMSTRGWHAGGVWAWRLPLNSAGGASSQRCLGVTGRCSSSQSSALNPGYMCKLWTCACAQSTAQCNKQVSPPYWAQLWAVHAWTLSHVKCTSEASCPKVHCTCSKVHEFTG